MTAGGRNRRGRLAARIMEAVEAALEAGSPADAEKWAKTLTVMANGLKAAESLGSARSKRDAARRRALIDAFDKEIDRLVEQRLRERLSPGDRA